METLYIVGQVVLGLFFVKSGLMHFMKMDMMEQFAKAKKLPSPKLAVIAGGVLLLAGGLSVLSGMYLEYGLWALVVFLLLASFTMHNFWVEKDMEKKMMNMHYFMGNVALAAALLMLMGMMNNWPWVMGA